MSKHVENFLGAGDRAAIAKRHVLPALILFIAFAASGLLQWLVAPGALTYVAGFPALILILLTALARVNDIKDHQTSLRWQARRTFLVFAAGGAVYMLATVPTWGMVLLYWGVAGTWLTTPGQPPWHQYLLHLLEDDAS